MTFEDGTTLDCLQKLFRVGNDVVAGFAGDVRLGFALLQNLINFLKNCPNDEAWKPPDVAERWCLEAKYVAHDFPPRDRDARILMLAVHPSETLGTAPFHRPYLYTFAAPQFQPVRAKIDDFVSIGSGAVHQPFIDVLSDIKSNPFYQQMIDVPNGMQVAMMHRLTRAIEENPIVDVSPQLHFATVWHGGASIGTANRRDVTGKGKNDLAMPIVAKNYLEYLEIVGRRRRTAIA